MKPVKVIIADDHALFVNGLELLLKEDPDVEVIAVANDGNDLLRLTEKQLPDVILLDVNMPNMNGLDALKHIKKNFSSAKVIILSTYQEDHLIEKAKQYGANGYLLKNCNKDELIKTIFLVAEGKTCFPYRIPKTDRNFTYTDILLKKINLTKRELEITELIKEGLTNQQMAEKLFLSIFTVETHRKNIMQKLQLKNPAALIRFLLEIK